MFNALKINDQMEEECGIFGIYLPGANVAELTYIGLFALQHRGQESAGIAVSNGEGIKLEKGMGLVAEVFNKKKLAEMPGQIAIGHVRYSTTGSSYIVNAQPIQVHCAKGDIAVSHNGNLVNAGKLRRELAAAGSVFQSTNDSEVIVNLIARSQKPTIEEAIIASVNQLLGAFSLTIVTQDKLIGLRDGYGVRPLCLGKLSDGYVLASETCGLDAVGAKFIRDIDPGEMVVIDEYGLRSFQAIPSKRKAFCIFEYIYFARPDSDLDGVNVQAARRAMGRHLAKEYMIDADIVIPVPDSGTAAAMGYAEASGIPFEQGLIKNRYIGRTFIQPEQKTREMSVRLKLNPIKSMVHGKRVILVDDSIVRGTTSGKIVRMLKDAGAKEVHMCISSPPIVYPCYYGIDTSVRKELIAASKTITEIQRVIGAESLCYLSLEGLIKAIGLPAGDFCVACFNGDYAIPVPEEMEKGKHFLEIMEAGR